MHHSLEGDLSYLEIVSSAPASPLPPWQQHHAPPLPPLFGQPHRISIEEPPPRHLLGGAFVEAEVVVT